MDTKTEKKAETKAETTAPAAAETKPATTEEKPAEAKKNSEFKEDVKRYWAGFVRFIKPFRNLDEKKLTTVIEPFLAKHINLIYVIALVLLIILTLYTIFAVPTIAAKFTGLVEFFLIFILVRLVCELISSKK